MQKIIKKYGNSLVIIFNREDIELYGLKEGDKLDFDFLEQELRKRKK
jgi:antitoxin component of MazEF toxin-antitoxin module